MGKIVYLLGRSSSGKDTIYKKIMEQKEIAFHTVVLYTTRPIRAQERNGEEYYFVNDEKLVRLEAEGKV